MAANANLHKAKDAKNDEFYTQLTDVSKELMHYKQHFKGKTVLCNCDDPTWSAFWKYFHLNFAELGLKKLISTHYDREEATYKMEYAGGDDNDIEVGVKTPLEGNGDFRNQECLELLDEADIVVTNPPFSLFREYVAVLMEHQKKFIIIGSKNAITYKEFFPLLKDDKVWIGCNNVHEFAQPDGSFKKFGNIGWYTNLDIKKRHEDLILWQRYYDDNGNPVSDVEQKYPHYDNYDAINVDRLQDIPCDYFGIMGVPISFMDKYNPSQMKIIGADYDYAEPIQLDNGKTGTGRFYVTRERERERERTLIQQNSHQASSVRDSRLSDSTDTQSQQRTLSEDEPQSMDNQSTQGFSLNGEMSKWFKVVGVINHGSDGDWDLCKCIINGKEKFKRIAIRRRKVV